MTDLDLRETRCPMALVLLKQQLLNSDTIDPLKVLFSNQEAMRDIRLYLEKKKYHYRCEKNTLFIVRDNRE